MKSKVLNRKMFRKGMDIENVGIMDGFKDSMHESLMEALSKNGMPEEDDDALEREDDDEEGESGKMIGRTPRSPEILMNTLRGDMRSPDARRKELADLVGEEAAMETPEEVLTLLQSKLGQGIASVPGQQNAGPAPGGATPPPLPPSGAGAPPSPAGGGLADLGQQLQGAGVTAGVQPPAMPPGGMPPGGMPPGGMPPGGALPPLNMADGGEVSYARYAAGGEAKKKANPFSSLIRPLDSNAVESNAKAYERLFSSALGQDLKRDKELERAALLADISRRSFAFAANQDARGNPLSGSFASRAAGAFGDVPSLAVKSAGRINSMGQEARLAALQQAISDEVINRKLEGELTASALKDRSTATKPLGMFSIQDSRGNILANVERVINEDGVSTSLVDLRSGKPYVLGEGEQVVELPTASKNKSSPNSITLYDINKRRVVGSGVEQDGRLFFLDGTPAPANITGMKINPSMVPDTEERKEDSEVKIDAADQILMPALRVAQSITENPDSATSVNRIAGALGEFGTELSALGGKFGGDSGAEKINDIFNPNNYAVFDEANITSNNMRTGLLALAYAVAKAQRGGKITAEFSNKDMEQALMSVGAGSGDPRVILSNVNNVVRGAYEGAFINRMNAYDEPWDPPKINGMIDAHLRSKGIDPAVFNPRIPPAVGSQGPSSETGIAPSSNVIYSGDGFSIEAEND